MNHGEDAQAKNN